MKTTCFTKCAASSAFIFAGFLHAETMYWAASDWKALNEQEYYLDESGNYYPHSDAWVKTDADLVFDPAKMLRDNFEGIRADMTVKSLTFMDATGKYDHYWWQQHTDGYGKTLTIKEDLNFYYAVKNNNNDKRIHISANNVNINVTADVKNVDSQGPVIDLRALNSLVVGSDFTVSRVGADGKGNIDLGWTGTHSEDSSRRGIYIGGNLSLANMGQFYASNSKVFDVVGNFTAESTVGKVVMQNLESISVGGNLTALYNEWLDINNTGKVTGDDSVSSYIGGIEIGATLKKAGGGGVNADDSGFLKIGGDAVFEDSTLRFERVGNIDGSISGGVDIGYDAESLGSQHGGSLVVTNGTVQGTDAGNISINKDLLITDGEIQAARSGIVSIGGDFIINNSSHRVSQFNDGGADITIGGNLSLTKSNLYAWKRGDIRIGGTFSADSTSILLFDGVKSMEVNGGDMIAGANFEAREIGYLKVKGDLGIGGDAMIFAKDGVNGGAQSADNAGIDVGGRIKMNGGKLGTWFYADASDPSKYAKDLYVKSGGIDGTGSLYLSNEKANTTDSFSVTYVLNSAVESTFTGGVLQYGPSQAAIDPADFEKMRLNIIKNGAGMQNIAITDAASMWRGTVTVNNGLLRYSAEKSDTVKVDMLLNGGGSLSAYGASDTWVNTITSDGGTLVAGSGIGEIFVSEGMEILAGGLSIMYDGEVSEGFVLDGFLSWDNAVDADMRRVLADAFSEGKIALKDSSGRQYEVADYSVENNTLSVTYGAIPEPAAVAALFGAIAFGLAAFRRRK